jgi:hypothetical protein
LWVRLGRLLWLRNLAFHLGRVSCEKAKVSFSLLIVVCDPSEASHGGLRLGSYSQSAFLPTDQRAAAYKQVAQEVRAGAFKDRSSALVAFVKAQRAHSAAGTGK